MGLLRAYFRRKMNPLPPEYAFKMRNRFRFIYFFGAWNLFAYAVYSYVKDTKLTEVKEGENTVSYYKRLLGHQDYTVHRYKGTKFVEEVKPSASENLDSMIKETDSP